MAKIQQIETHAHRWCPAWRADNGDLTTTGTPTCRKCQAAAEMVAANERQARVVFGLIAGAIMAAAIFAAVWPLWHR